MKICVFSDIHGNYDALKILIDSEDFKTADIRICLGDVVIMGPFPNECIQTLLDNDCIWLMGNHDSYIANGLPKEEFQNFTPEKIAHQEYMINIIKQEFKDIIKKLPKDYLLKLNNEKIYFTHYVWKAEDNVIDIPDVSTEENISKIFKNIDTRYIFYGHEHNFSHFYDSNKEYICIDSLGLKYPGHYLIIDIDEFDNVKITSKKIYYDVEKCKLNALRLGYPNAKKFIGFLE